MPAGSAALRPAWPGAPGPPAVDALYDARRGVYYTKPVLRGRLHLVWFEISVVIGTLLLARAHGACGCRKSCRPGLSWDSCSGSGLGEQQQCPLRLRQDQLL
jgi:hypothetical protein